MTSAKSCVRYLATQQCRLRHLRSLCARNVEVPHLLSQQENEEKVGYYFSLHTGDLNEACYTSEAIYDAQNLNWKSFNWSQCSEKVNLSASTVIVQLYAKVETVHSTNSELLWSHHICFKNLNYVGEQIPKDNHHFPPNTLVFEMFEGFYAEYRGVSDGLSLNPSKKLVPPKRNTIMVHPVSLRDSYDLNALKRVHMVQRAIKQTKVSVLKIRNIIQSKLSLTEAIVAKCAERECLVHRVNILRDELMYQNQTLQRIQQQCKTKKEENEQKYLTLLEYGMTLKKNDDILSEKSRKLVDCRENLVKTMAQLGLRRRQLISELASLYRIEQVGKDYTIYGVTLPNSEDFAGCDDTMISVALGYVCHLVAMIAYFLHVPLRYPMVHLGSRAKIYDHFLSTIPDSEREFPLHVRGKDKLQFNYGVYILNKNISQLRFYCGLPTQDLRLTLPNLKSLLDQRFTNKPDQQLSTPIGIIEKVAIPRLKKDHQSTEQPGGSSDSLNLDGAHHQHNHHSPLWKPSLESCRSGNLSVSLDQGLDEILHGQDGHCDDEILKSYREGTAIRASSCRCNELHQSEPSLAQAATNGAHPEICNVVASKAIENVMKPLNTCGSESESEELASLNGHKLLAFSSSSN